MRPLRRRARLAGKSPAGPLRRLLDPLAGLRGVSSRGGEWPPRRAAGRSAARASAARTAADAARRPRASRATDRGISAARESRTSPHATGTAEAGGAEDGSAKAIDREAVAFAAQARHRDGCGQPCARSLRPRSQARSLAPRNSRVASAWGGGCSAAIEVARDGCRRTRAGIAQSRHHPPGDPAPRGARAAGRSLVIADSTRTTAHSCLLAPAPLAQHPWPDPPRAQVSPTAPLHAR